MGSMANDRHTAVSLHPSMPGESELATPSATSVPRIGAGTGEDRPSRQDRVRSARPWVRRHRLLSALLALVLLTSPWAVSFGLTMAKTAPGSLGARAAEWARDHGGASVVDWAENAWYSRHPPPRGGQPPEGAIPAVVARPEPAVPAGVRHLPAPAPIVPIATPALPGEGVWHPAGRPVDGVSAVYEAFLRPDPVHTSVVVGVAWMDTTLLQATLYSGSYIPGGGPWTYTAPIGAAAARTTVAAFNSGFRLQDAQGGYYSEGRTVVPLRTGAASLVIYRNGRATVADWGRDATMTAQVLAVRQNLDLLVDHGVPAPDLASGVAWGATLGNQVYVWRSGLGVTADGALVYVGGPGLDAASLAAVLVRAGAVRAMELDINTDWVNFTAYHPSAPGAAAQPSNGTTLVPTMNGGPSRYFEPWWDRDFVVMSAGPAAGSLGRSAS